MGVAVSGFFDCVLNSYHIYSGNFGFCISGFSVWISSLFVLLWSVFIGSVFGNFAVVRISLPAAKPDNRFEIEREFIFARLSCGVSGVLISNLP